MSSFGFDAPEDVTDTTRPDADSLPVPPEDPAEVDDTEATGEATDEGADSRLDDDARLDDDQDPPEHPFVPSPS
ncbi:MULTISPECIES: hypothetical protein [unclassified Rathayibacter]|jgi:hypothetical protein|uniref:hypothetical protein n=1 Tax=unclassified Rathayibacter TaxID=2609250 RepID=UPI000F4CC3E0|nr:MULTISPECIES: hypothetical protein [unclassified Rathayibacter]MCJ1673517.1 hypothetical protein [Rathayibacter sp. VKM Ac-2929]MCJ1681638.1 hypothetical protein [Rathayibacter sp. VKM Ac-2928]ROS21954.1 hypothetical protein EDF22_3457 [Rathayibacter sp. PhB127]